MLLNAVSPVHAQEINTMGPLLQRHSSPQNLACSSECEQSQDLTIHELARGTVAVLDLTRYQPDETKVPPVKLNPVQNPAEEHA